MTDVYRETAEKMSAELDENCMNIEGSYTGTKKLTDAIEQFLHTSALRDAVLNEAAVEMDKVFPAFNYGKTYVKLGKKYKCVTIGDYVRSMKSQAPSGAVGQSIDLLLSTIRTKGWAVAIHNDYRLHDESHTFWLFTKDDRFVKGEGKSDIDALRIVLESIHATPAPQAQADAPAVQGEGPKFKEQTKTVEVIDPSGNVSYRRDVPDVVADALSSNNAYTLRLQGDEFKPAPIAEPDSDTVELLPCPFCGGVDSLFVYSHLKSDGCVSIACSLRLGGCGGMAAGIDSKSEAIASWNQRPDAPPAPADTAPPDTDTVGVRAALLDTARSEIKRARQMKDPDTTNDALIAVLDYAESIARPTSTTAEVGK